MIKTKVILIDKNTFEKTIEIIEISQEIPINNRDSHLERIAANNGKFLEWWEVYTEQ